MPSIAARTLPMPMKAFVEMSRWRASLFLVDEALAVLVDVLLPGLLCSPWQVNLPLMTLLEPTLLPKVAQSAVMLAELWRLKAPRQSWSEGRTTLDQGKL